MKPRGVAWNGAGGWLIVWHARHENFSRTVSITFRRRGTSSNVSVTSPGDRASRSARAGHRFRSQRILRRRGFYLLKLQFELIQQSFLPLRATSIKLPTQLLDHQL
jgi:hypothetical protein